MFVNMKTNFGFHSGDFLSPLTLNPHVCFTLFSLKLFAYVNEYKLLVGIEF